MGEVLEVQKLYFILGFKIILMEYYQWINGNVCFLWHERQTDGQYIQRIDAHQ